jgi:phage gp36-like protein
MPAYITIEDLAGEIPDAFLVEALDDNGDGLADAGAFDTIALKASGDVDALLSGRYSVPFTGTIPALVKQAARVFVLEMLYKKRGVADNANPWSTRANQLRSQLAAIANGTGSLDIKIPRAKPSGTVITERSKTFSSNGSLMA